MKKGNLSLLLLAALFFLCVIASQAGAQPFVLTKVADTNTPTQADLENLLVSPTQ